jgi:general secretion pathway protein A
MSEVKDPPVPPSFEDDPILRAGLDALDRGLNESGNDRRKTPAPRAPAPAPKLEPGPLPARGPDPPRSHRPLLDLFPMKTTIGDRARGALPGPAPRPPAPRSHAAPGGSGATRLDPLSCEAFYGLSEKPFDLSTDPKFFYHSASHDGVLREILAAIQRRDGIVVLTGGAGLGKTMLCRAMALELDRRTVTSTVFDPFLSVDDVLKTVLVDFGVVSRGDLARAPVVARDVLTAALESFLESLAALQATAVLIIDEAQNASPAVLAEVLAAFPAMQGSHRVQLVLVGQPALNPLLKRPELTRFAELVTLRVKLRPLGDDEVTGYVAHRLSAAGGSARVIFSDGAFERIHHLSRGVPRVVNLLCDRALRLGAQISASVIGTRLIEDAAEELDLAAPFVERRMVVRRVLITIALIALMLVGAFGASWVFRDDAARVLLQWLNVPAAPGGPVRSLPAPLAPIPVPADPPPPADNHPPRPRV